MGTDSPRQTSSWYLYLVWDEPRRGEDEELRYLVRTPHIPLADCTGPWAVVVVVVGALALSPQLRNSPSSWQAWRDTACVGLQSCLPPCTWCALSGMSDKAWLCLGLLGLQTITETDSRPDHSQPLLDQTILRLDQYKPLVSARVPECADTTGGGWSYSSPWLTDTTDLDWRPPPPSNH